MFNLIFEQTNKKALDTKTQAYLLFKSEINRNY